jgi:hypothetical protein
MGKGGPKGRSKGKGINLMDWKMIAGMTVIAMLVVLFMGNVDEATEIAASSKKAVNAGGMTSRNAKPGGPKGVHQKIAVKMFNQKEESVDLCRVGKSGSPEYEDTIESGIIKVVDTRMGEVFVWAKANTDCDEELQRETIEFVRRYHILHGPVTHKEKFSGVPSNSIGQSCRFKNLRSHAVDVYFDDGTSAHKQASLGPGNQQTTVAYPSHKFFYAKVVRFAVHHFAPINNTLFVNCWPSPLSRLRLPLSQPSDPDTRLYEFSVVAGKSLYELADTDPSSSRMQKFAKEQKFRNEYLVENGREYVGFYDVNKEIPRPKPSHHMWPAEKVGDTYEISTAAGYFDCDPTIDKSCKGPNPGNATVTIEVGRTAKQQHS